MVNQAQQKQLVTLKRDIRTSKYEGNNKLGERVNTTKSVDMNVTREAWYNSIYTVVLT